MSQFPSLDVSSNVFKKDLGYSGMIECESWDSVSIQNLSLTDSKPGQGKS